MKKGLKKVLVLVMAVVMLAGSVLTAMAAETGDINVTIKMNYPEQEAKDALVVTKTVNFNSEEAENGKAIDVTDVIPAGYTLMGLDSNVVTVYSDTPSVELFLEKEATKPETGIAGDVSLKVNVKDNATNEILASEYHTVKFVAEDNNHKTVAVADLAKYVPAGYVIWDGMAKTVDVDATFGNNTVDLYVVKKAATGIAGDVSLKVNVKDNATNETLASEYHIVKFVAEDNNHKTVAVADLAKYVPAGYVIWDGMAKTVDVDATFGNNTVDLYVVKKAATGIAGDVSLKVNVKDNATDELLASEYHIVKFAAEDNNHKAVKVADLAKYVPAGYVIWDGMTETVDVDATFGNNTVDLYVVKAEETYYINYYSVEGKQAAEVAVKGSNKVVPFETVVANMPAGYEFAEEYTTDFEVMDRYVWVSVKPVAERNVFVTFVDEATGVELEDVLAIKVAGTTFHTSAITKLPAGYVLCEAGDVYVGTADKVSVNVRKAEKTIYVSYIDEEKKMPFENGIEEVKVAADATYFNTSVLTKVPEGYELCVVGDVYFGENDTLNIEVRKVADAPVAPEKPEDTNKPAEKPAKPVEKPAKPAEKPAKPAETVKTGDVSAFLPMVIVMVGAAAVVAVLSLRRKNRR